MKDKNQVELLDDLMDEVEYKRIDPKKYYLTKDEIIFLLAWVKSMKLRCKHGTDKRV